MHPHRHMGSMHTLLYSETQIQVPKLSGVFVREATESFCRKDKQTHTCTHNHKHIGSSSSPSPENPWGSFLSYMLPTLAPSSLFGGPVWWTWCSLHPEAENRKGDIEDLHSPFREGPCLKLYTDWEQVSTELEGAGGGGECPPPAQRQYGQLLSELPFQEQDLDQLLAPRTVYFGGG